MRRRKSRKVIASPARTSNAQRTLCLVKKTIDAMYKLHERVQKLEKSERRRQIGFGAISDAVSCHEAEPYRDIEEIAEDDDGPIIG